MNERSAHEHIHVSSEVPGILQLRLMRPEKKNALSRAMYGRLAQALTGADADPAIRVITLTGCGDCFCSGNDVADFVPRVDEGADAGAAMDFLAALAHGSKPLVAAVNGLAVGIGVTMLLHCDLVYAADSATFTLPFSNLGLVPEAASTLLLPQLIGFQRAAEALYFGEPMTSARALALGLVNAVFPASQLIEQVLARCRVLAAKPAASIVATKALLRHAPEPVSARIRREAAEFVRLLQLPETKASMQAFLHRRR